MGSVRGGGPGFKSKSYRIHRVPGVVSDLGFLGVPLKGFDGFLQMVFWCCVAFQGPADSNPIPKGPCTQIGDTLAPKYRNRDYFKAQVYTI